MERQTTTSKTPNIEPLQIFVGLVGIGKSGDRHYFSKNYQKFVDGIGATIPPLSPPAERSQRHDGTEPETGRNKAVDTAVRSRRHGGIEPAKERVFFKEQREVL